MNRELSKFNRLAKRQEDLYHQCAKQAGLTDSQFWVLYALCEGEHALCQNAFCESWCYSKQTVNTAVANLEKAGLITMEYAQGSRKQKEIRLTPKGNAFCEKHIHSLLKAEEDALMNLPKEEREAFFKTMETFLDGLATKLTL